jgi:hypothetical protein
MTETPTLHEYIGRAIYQYLAKTYEEWRRNDAAFKAKVDQARQLREPATVRWCAASASRSPSGARSTSGTERPSGTSSSGSTCWRAASPATSTPPRPGDRANRNRILINCPPEPRQVDDHHDRLRRSTASAWTRLFRVLIISAGSGDGQGFLYGIKQRLTSPDFLDLQKAYAPGGRLGGHRGVLDETEIIFGTDSRSRPHEKDPNVQAWACGPRSTARADLVILDDGGGRHQRPSGRSR